jgi:hypothetical protein
MLCGLTKKNSFLVETIKAVKEINTPFEEL